MPLMSQAEILEALTTSGFGQSALRFVSDEHFQEYEVNYKLRLAVHFREAQVALEAGQTGWVELLREAIQSREDNIIHWRHREPLLDWCRGDPKGASDGLRRLWDVSRPLSARIQRFANLLDRAGVLQPGAQLCITSVLLMAAEIVRRNLAQALALLGIEVPEKM